MKLYERTQLESVEVEVRLNEAGRVEVWCPGMTEPIMVARGKPLIVGAVSQPGKPVTISVER